MLPIAILAGGFATRLGVLVESIPNCMLEIHGRPFVDWQLDLLVKNGYSDFVFCVSHKSEMVQNYLGDGNDRGINIHYSFDGKTQLGTGGAIRKALPLLGDSFGVIYGDSYLPIAYLAVEREFLNSSSQGLMTIYKNHNQFDASNVEFVNGKLINYEKEIRQNEMRFIDYGLTYFRNSAFDLWADESIFDLSVVCSYLAKERQLDGYEVFDRFYEIGSVNGIAEFSGYLGKAHNEL